MASVFESLRGALRRSVGLSIIALVAICSLPSFPVLAAEQKAAEAPKPAAPPPPVAIPLADIATRATEVSTLIANLNTSATLSAQIENITKTLPEFSEKLDEQLAAVTKTLEAEPTLDTLQSLQQDWQRRELETKGWLSALTQLADLQKIWGSTRASAQAAKAPGPILEQIDATLTAITAAQAKLQSERAALLNLQSSVGQEVTKCGTALAQIGQIQQKAVAGIFVPDAADGAAWGTDIHHGTWLRQAIEEDLVEEVARIEGYDQLPAHPPRARVAAIPLPEHVRQVGIAHWSDIV